MRWCVCERTVVDLVEVVSVKVEEEDKVTIIHGIKSGKWCSSVWMLKSPDGDLPESRERIIGAFRITGLRSAKVECVREY